MARHSKWHNIKHRKAGQDAIKGKTYSMHSKLISLAAQKGGDPDKNAVLFEAIAKAKIDNVPNDNIERAIKKGTGEDSSGTQIQEIFYEGYAPGGVAVIVSVLTDNKNRTASNIRHIFSKFGGTLGESGSVSWMFKRSGVIIIDANNYDYDKIEELVFETNAKDISKEESIIKIITSVEDLKEVEKFFKSKNIKMEACEVDFIPDNYIDLTEFEKILKYKKMMEAFDEDEDVENVSTNGSFSDKLSDEVDDFIEKNTFRT